MKPDPNKLYEMPHLKKGLHLPKLFTIKINIDKLYNNVRKALRIN
jgi:hypothetical protein